MIFIHTFFAHTLLLLPLFVVATPPSPLGPPSSLTGLLIKDEIVRALIHESSGDRAHLHVQQLALWARDTQRSYQQASAWTKEAAVAAKLQDVHVEPMPQSPQWHAIRGELRTSAPYTSLITSAVDLPMSLLGGSSSFTGSNLEVVDVGFGHDRDFKGRDLKGKVVLTRAMPDAIFDNAIVKGRAVGIISSWTTPSWNASNRQEGEFPDQVGWAGIPSGENFPKAFGFMISPRKAQELSKMLVERGKLTVDVHVQTEVVPGHFDLVSGVIAGSTYPNEEILVTAHLDHYRPGANDNASGSSVALEIARTLNHLVEQGLLPRPLRTIRFLWMPEFSGTAAWLADHGKETKKRLLNLNLDMLGADLAAVHSSFSLCYTPDWQASYINALAASSLTFLNRYNASAYPVRKDFQIVSVNGTHRPVQGTMTRYLRGSDHQMFNDRGIPGVAITTWPDDAYHTSQDSAANVDPTTLHRSVVMGLSILVPPAYAQDSDAPDLARLVAAYGHQRIAADLLPLEMHLLAANAQELPRALHLAIAAIAVLFDREKRSVESCLAFATKDAATIKADARTFERHFEGVAQRFRELAAAKMQSYGLPLTAYALSKAEQRAQTRVPRWVMGKEQTPYTRAAGVANNKARVERTRQAMQVAKQIILERGEGELRIYQFEDSVVSYTNGQRSLLTIRDAIYAEYGVDLSIEALEDLFATYEAARAITFG